jgi:hypothetical protein
MAIIKEDGTRQDIGIYVDDSDVDPCIPSVVAFAQNGELLVGEKALRQAVVNPHSTVYEVCSLFLISLYVMFLALIITEKISAECQSFQKKDRRKSGGCFKVYSHSLWI